jgi:hypothetical protein
MSWKGEITDPCCSMKTRCSAIFHQADGTTVISELEGSPSVLGAPMRRVEYATENDVRKERGVRRKRTGKVMGRCHGGKEAQLVRETEEDGT